MKSKHVPMRTCVVCREKVGKRGLFRIVRTPQGEVHLDAAGKQSGRGAYLCGQRACWERALKGKRLDIALRATISPADRAQLQLLVASLESEHQSI
ncbi:MAG: YlxR family protein [Chloroflexi bacterium]|nr:YlxR family protein [Chloroflexota bacterium]